MKNLAIGSVYQTELWD